MNASLNMVSEVHERLESDFYISGNSRMDERKAQESPEIRPQTVKAV